jgi:hypothetical protein
MGPATDDPHHAIAFTPAVSVRAELCDFAGKFQPRNVRGSTPRRSISTLPLQKVRAIESSTSHVHEYFLRTRLRFGNILNFQDLRSTEMSNHNSFHGSIEFGKKV